MLILKDITASLPNEKLIFQGLSHTFAPGERHIIQGANGAGKSTLLNILSGAHTIDAGALLWNGVDFSSLPLHKRCDTFLGIVFQNPARGCAPSLTVRQNLILAATKKFPFSFKPSLSTPAKEKIESYAEILGFSLAPLQETPMKHLSGGQQQYIALIMALLGQPKLLLLDEPTAALSPQAVAACARLLACTQEQEQYTILCVSHDREFSGRIGTQHHLLANARLELRSVD